MPRILLDQNVPRRLGEHLPGYDVETAAHRGWSEFANGELIRAAEAAGFDCIVTADRNLRYQQNLAGRKIAIVVLGTNHWDIIRADAPRIIFALANSSPGSFVEIGYPPPRVKRPRGPDRRDPEPT